MLHVLAMIAGCCIGSFLNVVFSRSDWYKGRSRCDACGYILKWYDLIPIVSYLILRGRCRKCKTKIAPSHFISELMMGAAFLCGSLCFCRFDMCNAAVFVCGLIFIALAAIEDYKEQMVYSWILNSGICVTAAVKCIVLFMSEQTCGAWLMIVLTIAFKLIAYLISKESKAKIGAGDFRRMGTAFNSNLFKHSRLPDLSSADYSKKAGYERAASVYTAAFGRHDM